MAKPTGQIDSSDGALQHSDQGSTADDTINIKIPVNLPLQPPHWTNSPNNVAGNEKRRQLVNVSVQMTQGVGDTITIIVSDASNDLDSAGKISEEYDGADSGSWEADQTYHPISGTPYSEPALSDETTLPHTEVFRVGFATTDATSEILALNIEMTNDQDYNEPEPVVNNSFEKYGRTGIRLYDPGKPFTAYAAKMLLAGNLNKLAYEKKDNYTVPL